MPVLPISHPENLLDAQFIFELLGIFLYIYTVYVLLTTNNPTFRHAFYQLFILGAIFDITLLVAIVYMRIRKRVGLCEDWEIWTRISNALTATNFITHVYLNMLIALNRFTSVMMPLKHDRIWQRRYYFSLSVVIILFSFGSQGYLFSDPFTFKPWGDGCMLIKNETRVFPRILSVFSVMFFEVDCCILSPLTIYSMHQFTRKFGQNRNGMRQEAGLAFFSMIKSVCFFFELIYELVNLFRIPITDNFFFDFINAQFWSYFYVLMFLNCPVLLILSVTLRTDIIKRWKKQSSHSTSTFITAPTTVL